MALKEDKKEKIIENAVAIFAEKGYYKATTKLVAQAAGVTQPYIFHFFENKEELFKTVIDYSFERIYQAFIQVDAPAEQLVERMGQEFMKVLETHREEVLMVMQAYTISEPGIREHSAKLYTRMHDDLSAKLKAKGVPNAEQTAASFIGNGLLITLSEILELPQLKHG